jgi:hypothetical protein
LIDQRRLVVGAEGQAPGQQLEEHDAQRVEVGLLVERVVLDLLRRHVGRRADAHDEGRIPVEIFLFMFRARPKSAIFGLVVLGDHDVGRLDVAVDDALR